MKKSLFVILPTLALVCAGTLSAQRPADAPATMPAGKPPDTVFIEELTWAEARDLIAAGHTTAIVGTAGTEQKGPHMADGEHKFVMHYAADKIARGLGKTLVAPVIAYVPEGSWERPTGHMGKPGTITLPEDRFQDGRQLGPKARPGPPAAIRAVGLPALAKAADVTVAAVAANR